MSINHSRFSVFFLVKYVALALLSPSAHAQLGTIDRDLVFVPITPCRILDTRLAGGQLIAGSTRSVDVTAVGDYAFQGGEPVNCSGMGAAGSFAALAVNFTIINPNVSGTLKAWPFVGTEPPTATSMAFAAGEVRSNFQIVKLDQGASANEMSVKSSANAHLTADVVGYFKAAPLPTLQCVNTATASVSIAAGATDNISAPACSAGYIQTATNCESSVWEMPFVFINSGTCSAKNNGGSDATLRASRTCCRIAP